MKLIGSILQRQGKGNSLFQGVTTARALMIAEEVLVAFWGDQVKEYAKPMYIKHRVLAIACLSSVMAQEIKFKELEIITAINNGLQQEAVTQLRFLD
jgi:hypothetical protein